ncbi:MAG: hypothetical protein ACKVOO_08075 [Burkholderiaceae bacterium]
MKPMIFNFAAKPAYRRIWLGFVLATVCLTVSLAWHLHHLKLQKLHVGERIAQARAKLGQLESQKAEPIQPTHSPAFTKQADQAAQLLKIDLNKAFAAPENLKIPGVLMHSLTVNTLQNLVEVEFEFAQMSQTSEISEALMSGYSPSPWQLMDTLAHSRLLTQSPSAGTGFKARWQAKLNQL